MFDLDLIFPTDQSHNDNGVDCIQIFKCVFEERTGAGTFPRVYINGKFIGGNSEITNLDATGRLHILIKQANESYKKNRYI